MNASNFLFLNVQQQNLKQSFCKSFYLFGQKDFSGQLAHVAFVYLLCPMTLQCFKKRPDHEICLHNYRSNYVFA